MTKIDFTGMTDYEFDLYLTSRVNSITGYWDVLTELTRDVLPQYNMDAEDISHLIGPTLKMKLEAELLNKRLIKGIGKHSSKKLF